MCETMVPRNVMVLNFSSISFVVFAKILVNVVFILICFVGTMGLTANYVGEGKPS